MRAHPMAAAVLAIALPPVAAFAAPPPTNVLLAGYIVAQGGAAQQCHVVHDRRRLVDLFARSVARAHAGSRLPKSSIRAPAASARPPIA